MAKSVLDIIPSSIDADTVPVALIHVDARRVLIGANSDAETILGMSRLALKGRSLTEIFYHDCALFDLLERAEDVSGRITAGAVKLSGPRMESRSQHVSVNMLGQGGFAIAMMASTQADSAAEEAPGLAAFGRILGHEVKNPLAGISGAAQLLMRKARDDQAELLELVLAESRRIERLVNDLSAFELFSAPRCLPCNVHEVLDRVLRSEELALGPGIKVVRVFDPSLPDIYGDADHLHEAFQNIVRNAGEAISGVRSAGQVRVLTQFAVDRRLRNPKGGQAGRSIRVTIEDNGPGIPPETQERMFKMFHTTKSSGSGLGLTVASHVVAAHNGTIEVDSRPGRTRFDLYLPIAG